MTSQTFFMIYETTNLINGKKYRGQHKTTDLNDDYLGSGKALIPAIKKYGKENFSRTVLFLAEDEKMLNWAEALFVDEDWISLESTYNMRLGGTGSANPVDLAILGKAKRWWSNDIRSVHSVLPPDDSYLPGRRFFNNTGFKKGTEKVRM